ALLVSASGAPTGELPPSQQARVEEIVERWSRVDASEPPPAAVLLGLDPTAKLLVAQAVSARFERELYRIGIDPLPTSLGEIAGLARLWQRETALMSLTLYVDAQVDGATPDQLAALDRFVTRAIRSDSFLFVGSREPLARAGFPRQL